MPIEGRGYACPIDKGRHSREGTKGKQATDRPSIGSQDIPKSPQSAGCDHWQRTLWLKALVSERVQKLTDCLDIIGLEHDGRMVDAMLTRIDRISGGNHNLQRRVLFTGTADQLDA